MHLKAVRRGWIAVGEVLVDQEKTQWIVAVQTEAQAAAAFVEIGKQPALAMKILDVFHRHGELGVVLRRARGDAFLDECVNALDQVLLFLVKPKSTGCLPDC